MVSGKVIQFRRGRKTQKPRHFLIEISGCDSREKAGKFVGKKVEWVSPGKKVLVGEIKSAHGNNGVLRAIFEVGLPGQAIGTKCEVLAQGNENEKKINVSQKRIEVKE